MSDITIDTVKKIAKLSRLRLHDDELPIYAEKLTSILSWADQLSAVNVDGIVPSSGGISMPLKMRDDVVSDGGYPDAIVKNAPVKDEHFFCVPKVIE